LNDPVSRVAAEAVHAFGRLPQSAASGEVRAKLATLFREAFGRRRVKQDEAPVLRFRLAEALLALGETVDDQLLVRGFVDGVCADTRLNRYQTIATFCHDPGIVSIVAVLMGRRRSLIGRGFYDGLRFSLAADVAWDDGSIRMEQ